MLTQDEKEKLQACCATQTIEACKCPRCGKSLEIGRDKQNVPCKLECQPCAIEYTCGHIATTHEHPPPAPPPPLTLEELGERIRSKTEDNKAVDNNNVPNGLRRP